MSFCCSQECGLSYDLRWGWGGEWHHRLCSHLNSDTVAPCVPIHPPSPPPHHLLSEAGIVLGSAFSFPPSKNTSFSLAPLKQLPVYEVGKMTLHLMMNGTWPLEPVHVGLTWSCIYISQEISRTHLFTSGGKKASDVDALRRLRCCKWRLNVCWSTATVNWTTFTAAFSLAQLLVLSFDTHPHW